MLIFLKNFKYLLLKIDLRNCVSYDYLISNINSNKYWIRLFNSYHVILIPIIILNKIQNQTIVFHAKYAIRIWIQIISK